MTKQVRGAKSPTTLRRVLTTAAVLLLLAMFFVAPVAAEQTAASINTAIADSTGPITITLENDITISSDADKIQIGTGKEVTINGNGKTIHRGGINFNLINVESGGKLTLNGALTVDGHNETYKNSGSYRNTLIRVAGTGSQLVMNDGVTLTKNEITTGGLYGSGLGVFLGAEFIMNGGSITGNVADNGGGIYINGLLGSATSVATIKGGEISGNTANNYGGGVYCDMANHLILTGTGKISENTAEQNGGGVYVNSGSEFTMSGGTISGNTANKYSTGEAGASGGGAIYSRGATTITAGEISGNTAKMYGGGIYHGGDLNLVISGGKITGNSAETSAGGVYYRTNPDGTNRVCLSGTAYIWDNTANEKSSNLDLEGGLAIDNALTDGAKIGVTVSTNLQTMGHPTPGNPIAVTAASPLDIDYGKYFVSDEDPDKYEFANRVVDGGTQLCFVCKSYDILNDEAMIGGTVAAVATAAGNGLPTPEWGSTVTLTAVPAEGYEFIEGTNTFTVKDENENPITLNADGKSFTMPEKNVIVSASFTPKTYSIKAGTIEQGTFTDITAQYGDDVTVTITENGGYAVKEITASYSGGSLDVTTRGNEGTFTMPAGDVLVSATFDKAPLTITVEQPTEGGTITISSSQPYYIGDTITITATPTDDTWLLEKIIVKDANGAEIPGMGATTFIMPGQNIVVTAAFTKDTTARTITVTQPSDKSGTISASAERAVPDAVITLTATPATGYKLDGFTVTPNTVEVTTNGNTAQFSMPADEVTVTATFSKESYAISEGDSAITIEKDAANYGDPITVTAEPAAGYKLDSITVTPTTGNPTTVQATSETEAEFTMPASAVTVTATFGLKPFKVNTETSEYGTVTANTATAVKDQIVTLTADVTKEGYVFDTFSVKNASGYDVATTGNTFTMPAEEVTVSLVVKPIDYGISVTSPHATVTLTPNSYIAHVGDQITISVTENTGYKLNGYIIKTKSGTEVDENNGVFTMPAEDVIITLDVQPISYTIKWLDEDGNVIDTTSVPYGEMPKHDDVPKQTTTQFTYAFTGWTPALKPVDGETSYTATYAKTTNTYTIRWVNETHELEKDEHVNYGATPTFDGTEPKKEGHTFAGWDKPIEKVTGDTTYTAQFTLNNYTITWLDEDGTPLEEDKNVDHGTLPIYNGETPTKDANETHHFVFAGWDNEVVEAVADTTYTATYTEILNNYTILWNNEDGTPLEEDKNVDYGSLPVYNGVTPTKAANESHNFVFAGWDKEVVAAVEDASYNATYTAILNNYTVVWKNGETVLETDYQVDHGTLPTFDEETPEKAGHLFKGWTPEIVPAIKDATYTAEFIAIEIPDPESEEPAPIQPVVQAQATTNPDTGKTTISAAVTTETPITMTGNTAEIADANGGVTIKVEFEAGTVQTEGANTKPTAVTGEIKEAEAVYKPNTAQTNTPETGEVKQQVTLKLQDFTPDLPKLDPAFNQDVSDKAKQHEEHFTPLAMLTAVATGSTSLDDINTKYLSANGDGITIKFTIERGIVDRYGRNNIIVLHLKNDNPQTPPTVQVVENGTTHYDVIATAGSFSNYVLGVKETPKQTGGSSGSQGQTVWLTETPTPTETVTPQPTETAPTTAPTSGTAQPTATEAESPLSVLGVLAGLGAAGVVMRRR